MLVTTCPGCDTTFKLTVAILEKAGGQVRCGRCARIFDANSRLREQPESETEQLPAAARALAEAPTDDELAFVEAIASTTGTRWFLRDDPPDAGADAAATAGGEPGALEAGTPERVAPETAGIEISAAALAVPAIDDITIDATATDDTTLDATAIDDTAIGDPPIVDSKTAVREALDHEIPEPAGVPSGPPAAGSPASMQAATASAQAMAAAAAPDWREDGAAPVRRPWPWAVAAGIMALTLAAQLLHAARSELAALPGVGPAVMAFYGALGREVAPPVALEQYASVDLTAVAEPVTDEHGWLIIETRVQNRGPKVQAYPHILVRILDRWEETIAGRYFAPDEYVITPQGDYSRMNVGTTVDAQFIIVDPGANATGFELEFCARVEGAFVCDSQ